MKMEGNRWSAWSNALKWATLSRLQNQMAASRERGHEIRGFAESGALKKNGFGEQPENGRNVLHSCTGQSEL